MLEQLAPLIIGLIFAAAVILAIRPWRRRRAANAALDMRIAERAEMMKARRDQKG